MPIFYTAFLLQNKLHTEATLLWHACTAGRHIRNGGGDMLIAWFFGRPFCDMVMALCNNLPNNKEGSKCGSLYALSNDKHRPMPTTEAEKPWDLDRPTEFSHMINRIQMSVFVAYTKTGHYPKRNKNFYSSAQFARYDNSKQQKRNKCQSWQIFEIFSVSMTGTIHTPGQIRQSDFINLRLKTHTQSIYVQSTVWILSQYLRNVFIFVLIPIPFNTGCSAKAAPVLSSAQFKGT